MKLAITYDLMGFPYPMGEVEVPVIKVVVGITVIP